MKVITNPISNIPKNEKSHVHGWTQVWRDQLGAHIDHKCTPQILNADVVYIDHGANFGGTLNLFGGADQSVYNKINIVMACKNIVSLDWDMPDYGAMLKKRINAKTTYEGITENWCDMVSKRLATVQSLKQKDLDLEGLTIGDSHTIAFAAPNSRVYRVDGTTLFGALKRGLREQCDKPCKEITISLGSIDVRHHILRHIDFDLKATIKEYVRQGDELGDNVCYAAPVPVEFEERRIPKSGFYKKTPFYGSWQDRWALTNKFIDILHDVSKGRVIMPPVEWYHMDPEKYAKTYMEHGSSFHIAPPFYRKNNWGVSPFVT